MEILTGTAGVIAPIVGGIMVLAVFFKLLAWIGRLSSAGVEGIRVKGILDEKTFATVHLSHGKTLENVRLVGFTELEDSCPPERTAILEHTDGRRSLVPAKLIVMIEIPPGAFHGV